MSTGNDAAIAGNQVSSRRAISWPVCVIVFFLGNVLLWADRTNFSVAAAVWAKDYAWTPSTIGMMLSAFSLGYLVMQPIGGWIADRIGPRRNFSLGMLGWSFWVLLTPIAPGILWLTATFRVLLGISEGPYIPGIAASVAKAVPSTTRRGRFSAFMQSGAQLGPAAGVFAAGLILSATGSPAMIFVIFGLGGILFALGWWAYARRFADPAPSDAQSQTAEAKARAAQAPVPLMKLITTRALWPLYIGYFALPYCQYIFLTWLPQYLTHYRHLPIVQASLVSSFPFLVAFLASNTAGHGQDWFAAMGWRKGAFHRKFFIALGALMYVSAVLVAATTDSVELAITMIIIANAGLGVYVYPFWTIVTDIAPQQAGTLGGFMNFCGIVGATISPYVSGVIAQATGAFVAPLQLAAAIMAVAAITAVLFLKVRPLSESVAETQLRLKPGLGST
jgi:MFS family permease